MLVDTGELKAVVLELVATVSEPSIRFARLLNMYSTDSNIDWVIVIVKHSAVLLLFGLFSFICWYTDYIRTYNILHYIIAYIHQKHNRYQHRPQWKTCWNHLPIHTDNPDLQWKNKVRMLKWTLVPDAPFCTKIGGNLWSIDIYIAVTILVHIRKNRHHKDPAQNRCSLHPFFVTRECLMVEPLKQRKQESHKYWQHRCRQIFDS